jgi:hypothetical protein
MPDVHPIVGLHDSGQNLSEVPSDHGRRESGMSISAKIALLTGAAVMVGADFYARHTTINGLALLLELIFISVVVVRQSN